VFPSVKKGSKLKRLVAALAIGLAMLTMATPALLTPRPAQAQFTDVANLAVNTGKWIWERMVEVGDWVYKHGAAIAFRNAARTFTQKIAYDSANMLASGGQGQTPLFTWKNLGKSISDAGDEAAGSFLDGIASGGVWGKFNICEPTGPNAPFAKLMITMPAFNLNLSGAYKPIKPRCTLSKFKDNWNKVLNDPEAKKTFLKDFSVVFDPKQSELGVGLNVQTNLVKEIELKKYLAEKNATASGGILPITQTITQFIKTPAPRIERAANMTTEQALKEPLVFTGDILADALGVFTNTLAAKLMKRLTQGDIPNPAGIGPSSLFGAAYGASGVEYAQAINATLLTAPLAGGDVLDMISEFSGCPSDTQYAAINNCTINSKFEQALRKAEDGNALTVKEAINKGLISGGWVFKQEKPQNVRLPDAWYLSDIKKLRLARILPLGWELAVQKVSGQDVSLNDVMNGFTDTKSPYYHLIDPNWILKAPLSQCRLRGPGQIIQSAGGTRNDTCVDTQSCIAEDEDGTCSAWGYCTKDKNIWRLGGDSCEFPKGSGVSPYASCQTFTAPGGNSVSYLQNSLANFDDGVCSGAVGCRWYSTLFNSSPSATSANRYLLTKPPLYLKNLDKLTCDAANEGCTKFLRLTNINAVALGSVAGANPAEKVVNQVINSSDTYDKYAQVQSVTLKSAPVQFKCYDTDAGGKLITGNDSPECKNYLNLCRANEVGCDLYTPKDGSPAIPGVFEPTNTCPAQCVGYQVYQQQPTFFEKNPTPAQYFIPATAQKCSATAVGCEEFTNVSQNEQREYYSQLRQCIKPGAKAATYFTWVGSELTGYQLKRYSLKSSSASSLAAPATTDSSGDCRPSGSAQYPTADPDCKQFYDVAGNAHYRNLSVTITASDQCTRYRATNVSKTDCIGASGVSGVGGTGGEWDATVEKCFYNAIPQEGQMCNASQVGCREYKGPTGDNVKLVFPISTFGDNDAKTKWPIDASPTGDWKSGTISNDSSAAFGHSFDSGTDRIIYKDVAVGNITPDQQYVISFWAKKSALAGRPQSFNSAPLNSSALVPSNVSGVNFWWQGVKKQWSAVPGAQAQTSPISLTANPPVISNLISTPPASSATTNLTWTADTAPTDQITVSIDNGVLPPTTYLADSRCANAGSKTDTPCTNNDTCRVLTSTCRPADFKCKGGPQDGLACPTEQNSECQNTTATCASGKCSNNDTISCTGTDATPCRNTTATCESTTKKCSGPYKQNEICSVNNDCVDQTPICQINTPIPVKTGTVAVNLPTRIYSDYTLPIGATYNLSVAYSGGSTVTKQVAVKVNNPLGQFSLTSPLNGATNQSITPKIEWTASARATNYALTVGSDSYTLAATEVCSVASCSFTVPVNRKLQYNQAYAVSIQAATDIVTKNSDNSISFTTEQASAGVFGFNAPADDPLTTGGEDERLSIPVSNMEQGSIPVNIAWSPSSNATSYIVTVYQQEDAGMSLKWSTTTTTATAVAVDKGLLKYDTYCRIEVTALSGAASKSIKLEGSAGNNPCRTQQPPKSATVTDPASAAVIKTLNPIFRWQRGWWNISYKIEVQVNNGVSFVDLCGRDNLTTTVLTTPELSAGCGNNLTFKDLGSYRWRVISKNAHPNVAYSVVSPGATVDWSYFSVSTFEPSYGGSGVTYGSLPSVVGSNKENPTPPALKGLQAVLSGSSGQYSPAKCTDPNNPPVIVGKQDYKVTLAWDAYQNPTDKKQALGFNLYRGIGGQAVTYLGCLGATEVCKPNTPVGAITNTTYLDSSSRIKDLTANRFVYQLRAFNTGGESKGISVAVATSNPPIKPSCVPTAVTPDKGDIVVKLMVDGQPAAGVSSYELNSAEHADVAISTSGDKISGQAPGDYLFNYLGGSLTGFTNAEIYSLEASPGGSINCVGAPCGEVQGILQAGQTLTYTINFVTPPAPPASVPPNTNLDFSVASGGLASDWQLYTFGPYELPAPVDTANGVRVRISAADRFVIDNVILQQVADTVYVNKGSWKMPKDAAGGDLCKLKDIGCKAYTDRQKTTYNLTGFSKICRAEAIGCEALVDTRNSDSAKEISAAVSGQTIYTPADQLVYRVYDTKKACAASMQACQRVGEPVLSATGQAQSWGDKFVKLNPDTFSGNNSPLCSARQNRCQVFKTGSVPHYFKDPGNNVCEYKQLTPADQYGWYKQGTSEACNLLANASFENFEAANNITGQPITNSGTAGDNIEDAFKYWQRNNSSSTEQGAYLYALPSFGQGYYNGNTILKVKSVAQPYSGVWSEVVELPTVDTANPRYFTVGARLYVPLGAKMDTPWILSQHSYNGDEPTPVNCPQRLVNGVNVSSCHHYEYEPNEPGNDYTVTEADKGKWVYKSATIKADPGVKYVSLGIIVATDKDCANGRCKSDQEIYVDGVSITEGTAPYAYACPSEMSSCKAYRDPALTNSTYYYLDNKKLDRSSCGGKVSEKDGCLLLNDLSQSGELPWNANQSYGQSRNQDGVAVASVSGVGRCSNDPTQTKTCTKSSDCGSTTAYCDYKATNDSVAPDTNLILKVRRDRVCSEWLSCQTSTTVTDPQTGKTREICYSLGRCDQVSQSKAAGQCANWLEPEAQQHPLDEADYVGRNVTWAGQEYSGYSIPGLCSLDMVSSTPACGVAISKAKACRIYPEGDAPFPAKVARFDSDKADTAKIITRSPGYKDANVCQPGEDCECSYQRANYTSETKFFGYKGTPPSVINKVTEDCGSGQTNQEILEKCAEQSKLKQITLARGLKGYCLETDSSRRINASQDQACLTWLPIDVVQGETSIFDDKPEAGFTPQRTDGNLLYCLQANSNANRGTNKYEVISNNMGRKVEVNNFFGGGGASGVGDAMFDMMNIVKCDGADVCKERGTFSTDSEYIWSHVEHGFGFSLSLSDFEKQLGGIQAIDAIKIKGIYNVYPFELNLSRSVESAGDSWSGGSGGIGIRVKFNPADPDKFLDVQLYHTPASYGFFRFKIVIYPREWCYSLAQVVDKQQTIPNKAQTNRVNTSSTYSISGLGYKYDKDSQGNPIIPPFGAVFNSPLQPENIDKIVAVVQEPAQQNNRYQNNSANAIFSCRTDRSGFACGQWMCLVNGPGDINDASKVGQACKVTANATSYCGLTPACPAGATCEADYQKDQPYICTGTNPVITIPGSDGVAVLTKLYEPIQEIFAKVYKRYDWSGKDKAYREITDNNLLPSSPDISSDPSLTDPPIISSVTRDDKGRVTGEDVKYNFSISTVQQSRATGEIKGVSPLAVTAAFYAYNPNGNQMPLRFVGVDWDNKLQPDKNIQVLASLKNHKPICQAQYVCAGDPTLSCADVNDTKQCGNKGPCQRNKDFNFGDSPDACIDDESDRAGYFFYTNVYTCSGSGHPNWDSNKGACVYEPSVAVRDNWGWWSNGQYDDADAIIAGATANNKTWLDYSKKSDTTDTANPVKIIVKPKSQ